MIAAGPPTGAREPYQALLAHAELELELAGRGQLTELAALGERFRQLVAALPDRPTAAAAPVLAKARLIHERTRIELLRLREELLRDVAAAAQAKRTASGYAGAGARTSLPALDRSA
jgi:hypothetical protein